MTDLDKKMTELQYFFMIIFFFFVDDFIFVIFAKRMSNLKNLCVMKKIFTLFILFSISLCMTAQEIKQTDLIYERMGDLNIARMDHALVPAGDGKFMAVGGHTTGFSVERSAEVYENGTWHQITSPSTAHDTGGNVVLPDGRSLVFGGHRGDWGTDGGNNVVDIFNPATKSFSVGPAMLTGRAMCKGLCINNEVYIFGDYWASYYGRNAAAIDRWRINEDGSFTQLPVTGRPHHSQCYPYAGVRSDKKGFVTIDDAQLSGSYNKYVDEVKIDEEYATLTTHEVALFEEIRPVSVPLRPEQYDMGDGRFLMTCWEENPSEGYKGSLVVFNVDNITAEKVLDLPKDIDGVRFYAYAPIYNKQRNEAYLIGCQPNDEKYLYVIVTVDCSGSQFAIKEISKADGLPVGFQMAGFALLPDGRIMQVGGSSRDNFDAHKYTFIFTPNSEIAMNIQGVNNDNPTPTAYYDISGRRLNQPTKGINIIKMQDGKNKKVLIK